MSSDENTLDPRALAELRLIFEGDPGAVAEIVQDFRRTAPQLLAEADTAVQADDPEALFLPVHSLKSSAAALGAHRLAEIAGQLEEMARQGDLSGAQETCAEAHRRLAAALGSLEAAI